MLCRTILLRAVLSPSRHLAHRPFPNFSHSWLYRFIMGFHCRLSWLAAAVASLGVIDAAAAKTSGVLEMDLLFPRNETYAPTKRFPVLFAFQNSQLAPLVDPQIDLTIWDRNDMDHTVVIDNWNLRSSNFSLSDPYLEYFYYLKFDTPGSYMLKWGIRWSHCTEDSLNPRTGRGSDIIIDSLRGIVLFAIEEGAQEMDLVAATTNKKCTEDQGVTVNITDTLVPEGVTGNHWQGDNCAVTSNSTPIPEPCRVVIDSAATESMYASCKGHTQIFNCTAKDESGGSAGQQLALGATTCMAVVMGAIGFLLL